MSAAQADIFFIFMAFLRSGALIMMSPIFGGRFVPRFFQVAFSGALALMALPIIERTAEVPTHILMVIGYGVREILIGLLLGFAVKMVFFIVEFGGNLISSESSLTRSDMFDPHMESQTSGVAIMLYFLTGVLVFSTNTHHYILDAFFMSYKLVPIMGSYPIASGLNDFVKASSNIFTIGLKIAAPIVALMFLINIAFAILGKAVPRMNVFILSFSVKIYAGLFLLLLTSTLIVKYILVEIDGIQMLMLKFIAQ